MNIFLETVCKIYMENGFPTPENFYTDLPVRRGSDLKVLLKTKAIVLKSEEMIQSWLYSFQRVSVCFIALYPPSIFIVVSISLTSLIIL